MGVRTSMSIDHRRKALVVAGSALLHGVVLGGLAFAALGFELDAPCCQPDVFPGTVLYANLEPRPLLPGEVARSLRQTAPPPPSVPSLAIRNTSPSLTNPRLFGQGGKASTPHLSPSRFSPSRFETGDTGWRGVPAAQGEMSPPGSVATASNPWQARAVTGQDAQVARSLRLGAGGCRSLDGQLTLEEQAVCDRRIAEATARAPAITGTNNPVRDARFAAEGRTAFDNYDARRAALKPNSRANPCPHSSDIMGRCEVQINIPIFSMKF